MNVEIIQEYADKIRMQFVSIHEVAIDAQRLYVHQGLSKLPLDQGGTGERV